MIRTLTLIEQIENGGKINYKVSGDLPLDAAARALVIIAFSADPPKKSQIVKKEIRSADAPAEAPHPP